MELNNEDCIAGITKKDDESIDLVFCDLPYGCTACPWDKKLDLKALSEQLLRVAKNEAPIIFTTTYLFSLDIIEAMGRKYFKYIMVWDKLNHTTPYLAKIRPLKRHEIVMVFYKKQPKIYKRKIEEYHTEYTTKPLTSSREGGIYDKRDANPSKLIKTYKKKLPQSILQIKNPSKAKKLNSTSKPIELIEFFLKYYTDENMTVLDPTMGSGSTGIACINMKRNFIGYELDETQYAQAVKRINEHN